MISYLPMSSGMKCANCGKGVMYGHNMSHAKNRTNRIFTPNLHWARISVDWTMKPSSAKASAGKRVKLCTKCLRMLKKKSAPKTASQPAVLPLNN